MPVMHLWLTDMTYFQLYFLYVFDRRLDYRGYQQTLKLVFLFKRIY